MEYVIYRDFIGNRVVRGLEGNMGIYFMSYSPNILRKGPHNTPLYSCL